MLVVGTPEIAGARLVDVGGGLPVLAVGGGLPELAESSSEFFDLSEPHATRAQESATTAMRRHEVECFIPETALQQAQVARIA